ncbi:Para-Rep C1 [Camellia lanceoleosa]|uniref:Para-Rep C1 n=1 Tax=Camellia lanceoleosa TaxID=1840588 RepID=A0ACC0IGG7_9ERIC|nr:Para-Rep C1 [Camellia lanceoleosa]
MVKAKQCFNGLHPHLEKMRGTPEEAIAHAKKEESHVAGNGKFMYRGLLMKNLTTIRSYGFMVKMVTRANLHLQDIFTKIVIGSTYVEARPIILFVGEWGLKNGSVLTHSGYNTSVGGFVNIYMKSREDKMDHIMSVAIAGYGYHNDVYIVSSSETVQLGELLEILNSKYEEDPDDLRYDEPSKYRRIHCDSITRSNSELFPDFCREWQIHVQRLINEEPDNRQIIWVYGEDGNEGKSTFARHLYQNCNWFCTRRGKTHNFIYRYIEDRKKHVMAIPRDKKDYVSYGGIEMLKDRFIESNKFEPIFCAASQWKIHVIVMSNFLPDPLKISEDRYNIIHC